MDRKTAQWSSYLQLLQSIFPSDERLQTWCYDEQGDFIGSSCPKESQELLHRAFCGLGGHEKLLHYASETKDGHPVLLGSSIGLTWAGILENSGKQKLLFVIGPVFFSLPFSDQIRRTLLENPFQYTDARWIEGFLASLPEIPILSYGVFIRYVLLFHNALKGEQLSLKDIEYPSGTLSMEGQAPLDEKRDRVKVYLTEQALLHMVRRGDIHYQSTYLSASLLSPGVPVKGKDSLRTAKTSVVVFTSLVCRAAMEGGLSPEIAYPLGDSYIQAAEDCRDSGDLSALAHTMYHDFIYRVHHLHMNPGYSHAIQKCCDYIDLSLDRKIRAKDLALLVGYSEYYLTDRFKAETGLSVSEYVRQAKVERAKIWLETTSLGVAEISEKLAFSTPNYFIQRFREATGLTPAQYRKEKKNAGDVHDPLS